MVASPIRGILLDFYGTLVHEDDALIDIAAEEIAAASPQQPSAAEVSRAWGRYFADGCTKAYGESFVIQRSVEQRAVAATVERFEAQGIDPDGIAGRLFAQWQAPALFADSSRFLDALAARRLPVVLVSNIDRQDLEAAIDHCGLGGKVDDVVTSSDVRAYKPRPEPFAAGLDRLGRHLDLARPLDPDVEILHIGDSRSSDIAGAQNYGIRAVHLDRSRPSGDDSTSTAAVESGSVDVIRRLDAVIPLLE